MIRDVMVHLDGSPEDEIRLEYGQILVPSEGGHLIGVFTNLLPDMSIPCRSMAALLPSCRS